MGTIKNNVRVRFAPSPTGPLHIGGVRTALFNYLFAKQHGGDCILRIEDTDTNRFVPGAEEYIIEAFKWLGIEFNEGIGCDNKGEFGPYKQSQRKEIYKKYVDQLLEQGNAYYAFDTPEELDNFRKKLEAAKSISLQYDASNRMEMKNSLSLGKEKTQELLDLKTPYVIRFKVEKDQKIEILDLIRGKVEIMSNIIDDKVIYKSADGLPTYHLANIVDDHLMEISHVIRGEEWLPSAPLHILLYRAFGWEKTMPQFAHLPLLLKPDGNGKLSKRDGDRLGFPVFPIQWQDPKSKEISSGYRESGYLAPAVINMLAFLGWNPGNEQEIFSMEELIQGFSLEKVSKSGAKFSLDKSIWFNHHYFQKLSIEILREYLLQEMNLEGLNNNLEIPLLDKIINLIKERCSFPKDLLKQSIYFFKAPDSYNEQIIKKRWKLETPSYLEIWIKAIENTTFEVSVLEELTNKLIQDQEWNTGQIYNCLRLCLVGDSQGPHLFDIANIIGKEESIRRVENAIKQIKL